MPTPRRLCYLLAVVAALVGCDRSQGPDEGYCGPMVEEQRLRDLFDSIASMDKDPLLLDARSVTDSALALITNLDVDLSSTTLQSLHAAEVDSLLPRKVFAELESYSTDTMPFIDPGQEDSVEVIMHQLGDSLGEWTYSVLEVPDADGWGACLLFFFHGKKLIAIKGVHHRYGLQLGHFRTHGGKMCVSHNEVFSFGSGLSQSNTFFYELTDDRVVPVYNMLTSAGNVGGLGGRRWWGIWSRVEGTDPIRITYLMENMWSGSDTVLPFAIDSVGLDVDLDNPNERASDLGSGTRARVWSYQAMERTPSSNASFDHLFIATHKAQLERELSSSDTLRCVAMLDWLNCVRLGRP